MPSDDLALNMFIVLISNFGLFALNHLFKGKYQQWIFGLLPSAAVLLCMSFPFTLFPGQIYDLRLVLLLVVILYGGYWAGISVSLTAFVYRYFLGGFGFIQMVLTFTPFLAIAFYLSRRFHSYSKSKKLAVAVGLSVATVALNVVFVVFRYPVNHSHFRVLMEWGFIEAGTMAVTVFLTEMVNDNMVMARQLHELEKMQLVNSLTASIAHEIRNPLTTSRGFLQLLREQNTTDEQSEYIDITISELDRASHIIDEYLSVSKPQINQSEIINISDRVQHAIDTITPYATLREVRISKSLHTSLCATIDTEKFQQAILNIMKNGIEAMQSGGLLTVRTYQRKNTIFIEIMDTGVGMTPEQVQRLGTPFYSTKAKGTGLGLMVSYRFLHMMKCKIHVISELNSGTTFSIRIPIVRVVEEEVPAGT